MEDQEPELDNGEPSGLRERIARGRELSHADQLKERLSQGKLEEHFKPSPLKKMFQQGALFGFADEIEAAGRAIWDRVPGEDYADAYLRIRNRVRAELEEFRAENPKLSLTAEIAGGLSLPGLGTGSAVAKGTTLTSRIGRGSAAGFGTGAAFGAGQAQEMEDIPSEALGGGALGTVVGGAIPPVVSAVKSVFSAGRAVMRPEFGANQRIVQAVGRDDMAPDQLMGALEEARSLNRPATLADVGGEAVKRELEIAVQSPGKAASLAEKFLSQRNKEQLTRLSNDLIQGTGISADNVEDIITKTMRVRSNAARPVYEKAMDFSAELNDDIVEAWRTSINTPLGKEALGKARKILNVEKFDEAPLMERLDAFKRGLDDVIGSARSKGENAVAKKALEMKKELVDLVDAVNPDYKLARKIWENESSYLDSIDRGRDVLKPSFTSAKLKQEFADMTDYEQEAFRIGVVDAVVTRLRQQSAQEPNLIKLLRSPEIRDKLKAVMKEGQSAKLDKVLDIEDAMFRTASMARHGSPTAKRQAAMAEQEKQLGALRGLDFILELAITPFRAVFLRALPAIPRAARERLLAKQNADIAKRLLISDPDEIFSIPMPRQMRSLSDAAIKPAVIGTGSEPKADVR